MRNVLRVALLCLLLAACSTGRQGGGLYVYMDEQGNLVAGEIPATQGAAAENIPAADADPDQPGPAAVQALSPEQLSSAADEDLARSEAAPELEQERFVTYIDGDGQVTRQRVDLAAERRAKEERVPAFEDIEPALDDGYGYLETVTPVAADCCLAAMDEAQTLRPGQERLLRYNGEQSTRVAIGGAWLPARVLALSEDVREVRVLSFKQRGSYLHPQLLMLDELGRPVLQVDNVFTRRFPESWSRYAYIEGTLGREPGQRYLVVYLGYAEGGLPGLLAEPDSELAIEGSVVVRGY